MLTPRDACRTTCLTRRGFTLVELLVVISIIGILMALLLPAVNSAREAGRRTQCLNNLKQIGTSSQLNISKYRRFPTGGWGPQWVGDPDRGTGADQPGGWVYNILPYLEQENLYMLGAGKTDEVKQEASGRRVGVLLSIMMCPSRRAGQTFIADPSQEPFETTWESNPNKTVARGDYAMNAGVRYDVDPMTGAIVRDQDGNPQLYTTGDHCEPAQSEYPTTWEGATGFPWPKGSPWAGVVFQRSTLGEGSVKDGASYTYLAGEKFINSQNYEDGGDIGDNDTVYSGFGNDNYRTTNVGLFNDTRDRDAHCSFGGPHSGIVHFAFCDGSTRSINVSIDALTNRALGERNDGEIIDDAKLQ